MPLRLWEKGLTFHGLAVNIIRSLCVLWTILRTEASGPFISWPFATQPGFFLLCHQYLVSQAHLQPGGIQAPSSLDPCRPAAVLHTCRGAVSSLVFGKNAPWLQRYTAAQLNLADLPERISAHAFKYFSSMFSPPEGDNLGEINKVYFSLCPLFLPAQCLLQDTQSTQRSSGQESE